MAQSSTDDISLASLQRMLRARGIDMSVEGLLRLVAETLASFPEVEGDSGGDGVSPDTREELREVGLSLEPYEGEQDPVAVTTARYSQLVATSLSTKEAADVLDVQTSRIRQRLNADAPTLYGFKHRREWKLPRFQFRQDGVVPNLEQVIPSLPETWTPLEVQNWFRSPHPNLEAGDEETTALTPLQWLESGREPKELTDILQRV